MSDQPAAASLNPISFILTLGMGALLTLFALLPLDIAIRMAAHVSASDGDGAQSVAPLIATVPMPDLAYAFIAAMVIRRPAQMPLISVLLITLLGEALISRPFGLHVIGVLLISEFLRGHVAKRNDLTFLIEWAFVAAGFVAMMMAIQSVLRLTGVPLPPSKVMLVWSLLTVASYPLMVAVTALIPDTRGDW